MIELFKQLLSQGIDPCEEKKKHKAILVSVNTFESIGRKWVKDYSKDHKLAKSTVEATIARLENHVFPLIGNRIINTLLLKNFIAVINQVKSKAGKHIPVMVRSDLINIMRYAILKGLIETNPAVDLVGLKIAVKGNHRPALAHNQLNTLLTKLDTLEPIQRLTVLINLHIFIRSSELRFARWDEIDLINKQWLIPDSREPIEGVECP